MLLFASEWLSMTHACALVGPLDEAWAACLQGQRLLNQVRKNACGLSGMGSTFFFVWWYWIRAERRFYRRERPWESYYSSLSCVFEDQCGKLSLNLFVLPVSPKESAHFAAGWDQQKKPHIAAGSPLWMMPCAPWNLWMRWPAFHHGTLSNECLAHLGRVDCNEHWINRSSYRSSISMQRAAM